MWEFDPSKLVAIPHQQQHQLIAIRAAGSVWMFARESFVPSTWLLLKREGFAGDLIRTSGELSEFQDDLGLGSIKKVLSFYHGQPNDYWNPFSIWDHFEELVLSQRLQVYKLGEQYINRLAEPEDRFYSSSSLPVAAMDEPIAKKRLQLSESLGQEIQFRWRDKIAADAVHFNLSYFDREYAEWSETVAVVGDAAWGAIVGLKDAAMFVVEFACDAATAAVQTVKAGLSGLVEFQNRMESAVLDALKGNKKALLDELESLGVGYINAVNASANAVATAAKNIARKVVEKLKEGERLFRLLMSDHLTRELLYDYIDSLAQSRKYTDSRLTGLKVISTLVFEIGIDVLLGLCTMGTAVVAKRAMQAGSKASKLAKARFGPFSEKAMTLLADLAHLMDSKLATKGGGGSQSKLDVPPEANVENRRDSQHSGKDDGANDENAQDTDNHSSATNQNGEACRKDSQTCTGGEPISLVTGEEILGLTDFTISGVFSIPWLRKYKSSNTIDCGMGHGWTHPFAEKLVRTNFGVALHTNEARIVPFARLAVGASTTNKTEKLTLIRNKRDSYTLLEDDGRLVKQFILADGNRIYPTRVQDGMGNGVDLVYNANCQLQQVVSDQGARWQLAYNGPRIEKIQWYSAAGQGKTLATYHYNDDNDLVAAYDAQGNAERYQYSNHVIQKRTLKSGYSFHFKWTQNSNRGRCIRNWGDSIDGQPTYDYRFRWLTENKAVEITDTRGGIEYYQFNDAGQPLVHRDQEGGETRYRYDLWGNITQITDSLGRAQSFEYDTQQRLVKTVGRDGEIVRFRRDAQGNVLETTDQLGQPWRKTYTANGLLASQTNPAGECFQYAYNALGLPRSITNPLGQTWHYLWDNQGLLTAIRNPLGQHTRYKRNSEGLVEAVIQADKSRTSYRYDETGRCTQVTTADGASQAYRYNSLGLLTEHTGTDGNVTQYCYNGLSQVVKRVDSLGHTLAYQYDGERNLIGLTNQNGEQYQLKYDLNERLIEEIGFDGRTQRYQYSRAGELAASEETCPVTGQCLQRLSYLRNNRGQLLEQWLEVDNGKATKRKLKQFYYDKSGRLTAANNPAQTLSWAYDAVGRPTQVSQGGQSIYHQYDALGRRIASKLPDGNRVAYQYSDAGLLSEVSLDGHLVAGIDRDELGRETNRLHGNQLKTEQGYDPQGRLQRQKLLKLTSTGEHGSTVNERRYGYNTAGQLSQIDDLRRGTSHYHYDSVDRLVQVTGPQPETFVHDPAGNLLGSAEPNTNTSQQVTGNRVNFYGDSHYEYDQRGNRVCERRGKGGKLVTHYQYDCLNQLIQVDNGEATTRYEYDALGRRVSKTTTIDDSTTHTEFLWNDDVLLSERCIADQEAGEDGQGGRGQQERHEKPDFSPGKEPSPADKTYLFEPGTFKPLAFVEQGKIYHYHLDHLGTPQEISNAQGKLVWSANYKAYGSLALADNPQVENNLRFQGQYFDEETGLHYNRFRYYDPEVGRFTQQDPIGLLGGINNYQYAPNPISWIDPYGLSSKDCPDRNKKIPENYDPLTDTHIGPHGFRSPDGNQEELVIVYRGVHPNHPDYVNAIEGNAVPWGGHRDVELHNLGDNQSDFTSWTTDRSIAERFAKSEPESIILEQQVKRKDLIWSPDNFVESEVLRLGPVTGAKVR
ncbi:RHS repeat-associated core domain-containing protein [Halioxenophilus aromaticivorans]|uniref:Type IV secretion protein Rhs n=1 Tax=Halioxenophilus aromaticivorans TaxID=1306992 RepID=A0AAV3U2U4_9ALTE